MKRIIFNILQNYVLKLSPTNFNNKIKRKILNLLGSKIDENPYIDRLVEVKSPRKLQIGKNAVISRGTIITAGGEIEIGDNVMIGYDCKILSQNHVIPTDVKELMRFSGHEFKKITIEDNVWIGANVVVLPGVTIGKGSVIAAGAVVTKDVYSNSIYGGVPAKLIRKRE